MISLILVLQVVQARTVSVTGCIPSLLAKQSQVLTILPGRAVDDKQQIDIIELPNAHRVADGKKKLCVFKDFPVLDISVFRKQSTSKSDPLVSMDADVSGAYSIAEHLFHKKITVALFESNTTFLIRNGNAMSPQGYEKVELVDTPFAFIANQKFDFAVFGDNPDKVTARICQKSPQILGVYVGILFLLLTCVFLSHVACYRPSVINRDESKFWVIDSQNNVRFGPEKVNENSWRVVETAAATAIKKKHSVSLVSRLKRGKSGHTFERVAAVPLSSDVAFVVLWLEELPEFENMELDSNFVSETHGIVGKPVISFSSFRDFKPIHVEYTLDNGVRCVADLPASVMAPFQPYGRLVTVILSILYDVTQMLSSPLEGGFEDTISVLCRKVGVYRGFFFNSEQKLICSYKRDGLEIINPQKVNELTQLISNDYGFKFVDNLLEDGKKYFVSTLPGNNSGLTVILSLDTESDIDTYEENGLPFFSLLCFFVYQIAYEDDQKNRARRILEMWSQEKDFTYCEFYWNTKELVVFKSPFVSEQPETFEDLASLGEKLGIQDLEEIRDDLNEIAMTEGVLSHKVIQDAAGVKYHLSAIAFHEAAKNDTKIIIVSGKVSVLMQRELDLSGELKGIKVAMENLGVCKFSVVGDDIVMNDDKIFRLLSRPTTDLHLKNITDPRDQDKLRRLISGEKVTLRLRNNNDQPVWFSASSNKQIGFIFCISNIEEANVITESDDERMAITVTSSPLIFWSVDPVTDTVHPLFLQPTIWDALSVDKETKFSRFIDYIDTDDRDEFTAHYHQVLNGRANQWSGEVRIMRIGGVYEWHRVVIVRSGNQSLNFIVLNINKQRELERKLRETQKLRDLLLSSGKLALWKFVDDNESFEEMERFDPGLMKAVTMNWKFIDRHVAPEYREKFRECLKQTFSGEVVGIEMNLRLILADGQDIWVSLRGRLRSNLHQIVGVCVDITELRHAYDELETEKKRAEEANRQKTIFLANMSHEIRTPMNGIFGILDILALKELTSEQRLLVDSIRASSFQLLRLLDDTLNLSKIEQGEVESTPGIFAISRQIEPICIASVSKARTNGVKFQVVIDKDVPSLVFGDSHLFVQIFNNLVSNALKFTKQGSIRVWISWNTQGENETCVLEVKDTGIGMTEDQQRIIFERFTQADPSVARFYGGTGLGLALVQEIVEFLHGKVSMESEVGVGTRFRVELPFESIMVPYSAPFSDGKSHIIMVSASDEDVKETITDAFENARYSVKLFTDPDEILKTSQESGCQVDVVFVEGNKEEWAQIKHVVNRIPEDHAPVICSVCEPGESAFFKYTLAKPLLLPHVVNFVDGVRYKHVKEDCPGVQLNDTGTERRILVVEDNKTNQFVMKRILQNLGCSFEIAENGQEAIDTLEKQEFDLIFMDCQMPVLDGVEATRIIRGSHKRYSSIPIVALTASAVEGDEQTCRSAGMDAYLAKPVRMQQISAIIKQFQH